MQVALPPDNGPAFVYEIVSQLRLKPGRHEVRAAVEENGRRVAGSAYTYVEVPDFARSPLSLSGAMLGLSDERPAQDTTIPIVPTLRRRFRSAESVTAWVRAHQGNSSPLQPVTVIGRVVDGADRTVFQQDGRLFAAGGGRSADFTFELPLSTLAPGPYLLRIEAARGPKETARRRFYSRSPATPLQRRFPRRSIRGASWRPPRSIFAPVTRRTSRRSSRRRPTFSASRHRASRARCGPTCW